MAHVDFLASLHKHTKRDYQFRVLQHDKAECARVAKSFGRDYWDGDRRYGYGGYYYDGRWKPVAEQLIAYYELQQGSRVLDIGCGKGFLLHEMKQILPDLDIRGIDVSAYALEHAKEEVKPFLLLGNAVDLPWPDRHFDLVLSLNTLHYLYIYDLVRAFAELERVKRGHAYMVVESYCNEEEKANLLNWQLTCECFYTPDEWRWLFQRFGYTGDYSFVVFE
ncbi:MAG: class I SAM-dependent methyltransferase [Lentisphaerae bacterium]|nr:class I SAM-dependent methyltransferase [Lentisphaerota bacterium]